MKPLKELGYVSVGMIITDINGTEVTVTNIIIPSTKENVLYSFLPNNNDLVLELNKEQYLSTNVGWNNLGDGILIKNPDAFSTPPLN